MYNETFLNQALLGPTFVFGIDRCSVCTVKLTKISCIMTLFKFRFIQDFGLFGVRFRQVSLYNIQNTRNLLLIDVKI